MLGGCGGGESATVDCNNIAILKAGDGTQRALARSMIQNGIVGEGKPDDATLQVLREIDKRGYENLFDSASRVDGFLNVAYAAQAELKKLNTAANGDSEIHPDNAFGYCWNGEEVTPLLGAAALKAEELKAALVHNQ
jgi:hypothetical protein